MVKTSFFLILLLFSTSVFAQNPQSAVGGNSSLWAGGEFSYFNPDYSCSTSNAPWGCAYAIKGITAVVDMNVHPKWGAEGEARWMHWGGPGGEKESNYVLGPRYRVYRAGRFDTWLKLVAGGGWITTPDYPQAGSLQGSYFLYAPGITFDYRLTRRLAFRADYEYQFWPSFAGPPTASGSHSNGLTPNGFSGGVVYRFLGQ